jgi:hypothetical protein
MPGPAHVEQKNVFFAQRPPAAAAGTCLCLLPAQQRVRGQSTLAEGPHGIELAGGTSPAHDPESAPGALQGRAQRIMWLLAGRP